MRVGVQGAMRDDNTGWNAGWNEGWNEREMVRFALPHDIMNIRPNICSEQIK